jgi:multiple sugar transport system substrate-binding protein
MVDGSRARSFAVDSAGDIPGARGRVTRRAAVSAAAALAAAIGGAGLAACSAGGTTGNEPATKLKTGITLQWGGSGNSQTRIALHTQQAELFTRKFPGIKVEITPDGENLDKIKAGLAAGTPMDLVSMGTRYAVFARQGALVALDSLIARDKYDLKDFFPAPLGAWQWRNKQWAMPFNGILTPYVNLKVTEESGAPRPPAGWTDRAWTYEAFLEYCRKVSRQEGGRTVQWGFTGPQGNLRLFMAWVWGNGGDLFDKDLTRVTLGDPPALEGLQFQADLINRHRLMPHPDELREIGNPFQTNRAGMNVAAVGGIAGLRRVEGLRWTVTAMPRGAKGAFIGGGGSGWFLLNGAGHVDETWELLKTVESPEADKLLAMAGEAPPGRRSVARDPDYLNPKDPPGADMKVIVEAMETAFRPDPILVQGDEILAIVQEELNQAWSGQRSVRASVDVLKARIEPLLKNERA